MDATAPSSPVSCPRCGRPSTSAFDATGVCRRCAATQIFSLTVTDKAGSAPPISTVEDSPGPRRIGPYTILGDLGHGGMGKVYLAQHGQLGRIVALKVIPSGGSATSNLEMRFLREARTIARLSHPHIVAVHDAGRDRGHAYFTMDYFEEGDLAHRLRAQPFTPRGAAKLLQEVAEAIAYSHAAGVLHRDLKPSNILLAQGSPRVADFGLASELESGSGLTARTAIMGTPHYLAPEALSGGSAAQGVPSDLYALGVILFELLTGRTPFAGASPAELPGLLAQNEAPPVRLLAPHVPRDLATICAKCLEYLPARRYGSAAELAEDLRRFLAGEPIVARRVSAAGQLVRWARRRPALAATWLLAFGLAVGSLAAALLLNRERLRADAAAAESQALADFFQYDLLRQASDGNLPDPGLTLRAAIARAKDKIAGRFTEAPLAEASTRYTLGTTFYTLGEYEEAETQLRHALALRRRHLGLRHLDTQRTAVGLAATLYELGRSTDAAPFVQVALATLIASVGQDHPAAIAALETATLVERGLGHASAAQGLARRALAITARAVGPDDGLRRDALVNFIIVNDAPDKLAESAAAARESIAIAEHTLGPNNSHTLSARVDLATIESLQGRHAEAIAKLRELLVALRALEGPDGHAALRALSNLGVALNRNGQPAEALGILTELLAAHRRVWGPEHPRTFSAMKNLAIAYGRNNRLDEAIVQMRELAQLSARTRGIPPATVVEHLRNLSAMLQSAKRFAEAVGPGEAAYTTALAALGPEAEATLAAEETYAAALTQVEHLAEAEVRWRHLFETANRTKPEHWHSGYVRGQWAKVLVRLGRPADAEPHLRHAYATLISQESALPANRRTAPRSFADHLALACAALGRPDEAAEWRAKGTPPAAPKP